MNALTEVNRVFISHKTADLLQCYLLTYLLESHGIPCRVDELEVKDGMTHTAAELLVLLTRSRGHILIVTKHALQEQRRGPRDHGATFIQMELSIAREVYKSTKRPPEYRTAFVMDGVPVRDGLRHTWIEREHGKDILKEPAFSLDLSKRICTVADYEEWKELIKSTGPNYTTSQECKLVSFFLRPDESGAFVDSVTLKDLDYLIRQCLQRPGPGLDKRILATMLTVVIALFAWLLLSRSTQSPPSPNPVPLPPSQETHNPEIVSGEHHVIPRGNTPIIMTEAAPDGGGATTDFRALLDEAGRFVKGGAAYHKAEALKRYLKAAESMPTDVEGRVDGAMLDKALKHTADHEQDDALDCFESAFAPLNKGQR
jgi:hypothetical protein